MSGQLRPVKATLVAQLTDPLPSCAMLAEILANNQRVFPIKRASCFLIFKTLLVLLLGGVAVAGPTNSIYVSDMFLSANNTHVFMLRTLHDNLGVKTPSAIDSLLVARPISLKGPDKIWPIRRTINYSPNVPRKDVNVKIPNPIDLYDILISRSAWPGLNNWTDIFAVMAVADETIHFRSKAMKHTFEISIESAVEQLVNSHKSLRKILPTYSGKSAHEDAVYSVRVETFAKECEMISTKMLRVKWGANGPLLAEFYCRTQSDPKSSARLILLVPRPQ